MNNKVIINTYLLTITLKSNGLNISIKRHMEAKWVRKQDPPICSLHPTHFGWKDPHRLKVKGW